MLEGLRRRLTRRTGDATTAPAPGAQLQAARDGDHEQAAAAWRRLLEHEEPAPVEAYLGLARSLRTLGRDAEAVGVVAAGRAHHDDVRLLALDARVTLRARARAAEVDEHRYSEHLLRLDGQLRQASRATPRADLLIAHAELLAARRRWGEVAERWAEVEDGWPDHADRARLERARALRALGQQDAARGLLDRVGGTWRDRPRFRREQERLAPQAASPDVAALLGEALAARRDGLPDDAAAAMRRAVTVVSDDATAELASPLLEVLATPAERVAEVGSLPATAPAARSASPAATIAVSGLLYSGSGAVVEDLIGHPAIHLPFATDAARAGTGELVYLKKPRTNLLDLLAADLRRPGRLEEEIPRRLLATILGVGQTGTPLVDALDEPTWPATVVTCAARLAARLRGAARAAGDRPVAQAEVETALRDFTAGLLAVATPAGQIPLVDNLLLAHHLDQLAVLPDGVGVAVIRDPRDQYVSQQLEYAHAHPVDEFTDLVRPRLRRLAELVVEPALSDRLTVVAFEDYVEDAEVRSRVWARLGLDRHERDDDVATFAPERSRRNIGLHARYPNQGEVGAVADAMLGDFSALRAAALRPS